MSIVFDARWINDESSGIGRYALGLLSGIAQIQPDGPPVVVLGGRMDRILPHLKDASGRFLFHSSNLGPMSLRNQAALPRLLRKLGASVYQAPYLHAPLVGGSCRVVITVHDLIPLRHPEGLPRSRKVRYGRLWNAWCRAQYRRADAIVTVSDFSRSELIDHAGLHADKVIRIHNGVDPPTEPDAAAIERLRERFGLRGSVITYLGRHDPYKNVIGLIRAFDIVRRTRPDATLVIGGRLDPRYTEPRDEAQRLGLDGAVVFTDFIDEPTRRALLGASDVFVFPSRYEGFGLPPLEAMAEGVPVVASNATSLPEVLGDAALLVDPDDLDAIASAILRVLEDHALRGRLIEAGRRRAELFTWKRCAEEHLDLYQRLMR